MPPEHETPPSLRANHAFKRLLYGSTLSMLGSRLTTIAYPLLVIAWGGSPLVAGLSVCAANAPSVLVYLPAGALVDRAANPRRTLIVAEGVRGLAIAAIVGALALQWKYIPLIITVAIVEESFEVVAMLAERRYVSELVDPAQAARAQVGMEARSHSVVLAGRALGGLLFGLGQSVPFMADFASFVISVASLKNLRGKRDRQVRQAPEARRDFWGEVRAGLHELRRDDFARRASLLSAGMTLVSQALIIVFLEAAHAWQVSSFVIGSVLAASGIGGLLGAMISRWIVRHWGFSPLRLQPAVWTAMLLVLFVSPERLQVPVMALVMMVLGLIGAMGNVEIDTYLLVKVPKAKLARVTSIKMLLEYAASAVGPALGGFLTGLWGTQTSLAVLLGLSVVTGGLTLGMKVPLLQPVESTVPPAGPVEQPLAVSCGPERPPTQPRSAGRFAHQPAGAGSRGASR